MNAEQRKVGLKTVFDLVKQKPIHLIFGTAFTVMPLLAGGIFIIVFFFTGPEIPKVDYDLVNKNGTVTRAGITDIELQGNISINNIHPRIISYSYKNKDQDVNDKYRTLDSMGISKLKIGDLIEIKYFNGQSIISGMEPLAFPTALLSSILISLTFFGFIMLGLLYWRISNQIKLYKFGQVVDAEVISMMPASGLPISGIGQKVVVHYQYKGPTKQKILGESTTRDFSILTSKKQGDTIKIFVSTNNESNSCVISKLDDIRNGWGIL